MFTQTEVLTSYSAGYQAALRDVLGQFTEGGPVAATRWLANNVQAPVWKVEAETLADTVEFEAGNN